MGSIARRATPPPTARSPPAGAPRHLHRALSSHLSRHRAPRRIFAGPAPHRDTLSASEPRPAESVLTRPCPQSRLVRPGNLDRLIPVQQGDRQMTIIITQLRDRRPQFNSVGDLFGVEIIRGSRQKWSHDGDYTLPVPAMDAAAAGTFPKGRIGVQPAIRSRPGITIRPKPSRATKCIERKRTAGNGPHPMGVRGVVNGEPKVGHGRDARIDRGLPPPARWLANYLAGHCIH